MNQLRNTNPAGGQFVNPRSSFANDPMRGEIIQPIVPTPMNPYIKDSGAPVNFNPRSQQTIAGAFGTPIAGSYDRSIANPTLG